jgi:DNA modification methylase
MTVEFTRGNSTELIKTVATGTVDLLYIDPPFGTTQQFWDEVIDWDTLFPEMIRVLKPTGMLVIHCSIPFTYQLIRAAPYPPLYHWIWNKKGSPTNFLNANKQPLRCCEEILIWKKTKPTYYRQQIGDEDHTSSWATPTDYYGTVKDRKKTVIKGKTRTHYLEMKRELDGFSTRPKEIVELMIQSYSKEGDTVLDLFCYKGLSGVVCRELKRKWIGFDKYHSPTLLFEVD